MLILTGAALILSACGAPVEPAPSISTATVSPPISSPTSPSPALGLSTPDRQTIGGLFDGIHAGWADTIQFREISSFATESPASPASGTPPAAKTGRTIREVFGIDQVRAAAEENGQLVYEIIIQGGDVYLRGTLATLFDPALPPGDWLRTDVAAIAAQPQLGEQLLRPVLLPTPSYSPPERLRPQVVRDLGAIPFRDGSCTAFAAADTTSTGARIDLTISVAENGELCMVETRSPGLASQYQVEALDAAATLSPPVAARAAPLASPLAPASPVAGD